MNTASPGVCSPMSHGFIGEIGFNLRMAEQLSYVFQIIMKSFTKKPKKTSCQGLTVVTYITNI